MDTKQEALDKLNNYFKWNGTGLLKILDTPSDTAFARGGYTGVTAQYLLTYVVNTSSELLLECINELLAERIIATINCDHIERQVFEMYNLPGRWRSQYIQIIDKYKLDNSTFPTKYTSDEEE
jgi:hypothetical protein